MDTGVPQRELTARSGQTHVLLEMASDIARVKKRVLGLEYFLL